MPSRITPMDVKSYADADLYRLGEQVYEGGMVRHRFQSSYGLQAIVKGKDKYRVEVIVEAKSCSGVAPVRAAAVIANIKSRFCCAGWPNRKRLSVNRICARLFAIRTKTPWWTSWST